MTLRLAPTWLRVTASEWLDDDGHARRVVDLRDEHDRIIAQSLDLTVDEFAARFIPPYGARWYRLVVEDPPVGRAQAWRVLA